MKFILHETLTCSNKKLPWFNQNIIELLKNKNISYKSHTTNENSTDKKEAIKALQDKLTSTIENAKGGYFSTLLMKLSNSETSSKVYCSILKTFANDKKTYNSPPYYNGNCITDFRPNRNFLSPFLQNNVLYYRTVVNVQLT